MDGQYDYIEIDAYDIKGSFMTKDLDRQLEKYSIKRRSFLGNLVLKKGHKNVDYYGALTIYNNTAEYQFWIIGGVIKDLIKL